MLASLGETLAFPLEPDDDEQVMRPDIVLGLERGDLLVERQVAGVVAFRDRQWLKSKNPAFVRG